MYSKIKNPFTGEKVNTSSKKGINILKNYINKVGLLVGGNSYPHPDPLVQKVTDIDSKISELRKLAKNCADNQYVLLEIDQLIRKIILIAYKNLTPPNHKKITKKEVLHIFLPLPFKGKDSAGQVTNDDLSIIEEVLLYGNLREKMTLIMNFCETQCQLLWDIMINYDKQKRFEYPTWHEVERRQKRAEKMFGVPWNIIKDMKDDSGSLIIKKKNEFPGNCHTFLKPDKNGPVSFARMGFKPDFRSQSGVSNCCPNTEIKDCNYEYHGTPIDEVYPPLSYREKKYLGITEKSDFKYVPCWVTGYKYWDVKSNNTNIFKSYADSKKFLTIAGPSANTDMKLDISKFFNCNLELMYLACVAWMGNPPDHSIFEMALATTSDVFKNDFNPQYKIDDDPFEWTEKLLKKYSNLDSITSSNSNKLMIKGTRLNLKKKMHNIKN